MNEHTDSMELFTQEELVKVTAEMQREVDELQAWLHSPEGKAWAAQQLQEAIEIAEKLQKEYAAGKYDLSPAEVEQLRRDGVFVSHHKKGADND